MESKMKLFGATGVSNHGGGSSQVNVVVNRVKQPYPVSPKGAVSI
jgi:hypothetical protein